MNNNEQKVVCRFARLDWLIYTHNSERMYEIDGCEGEAEVDKDFGGFIEIETKGKMLDLFNDFTDKSVVKRLHVSCPSYRKQRSKVATTRGKSILRRIGRELGIEVDFHQH